MGTNWITSPCSKVGLDTLPSRSQTLHRVMHYTGHVSVNTRPHPLHWGDQQTAILRQKCLKWSGGWPPTHNGIALGHTVKAANCLYVCSCTNMWDVMVLYCDPYHKHRVCGSLIVSPPPPPPSPHPPTHTHTHCRSDHISETVHPDTAAAASKGNVAASFPYHFCPSSIPS